MEKQIVNRFHEAENTLKELKQIVCSRRAGDPFCNTKGNDEEGKAKDLPPHKKYMTYSATRLVEKRGHEVFRLDDPVGLFYIDPNSPVRTSARSSNLRIFFIPEQSRDSYQPPAFLQVGEFVYPLEQGSMVYRSEHKYYLFPDLLSTIPGTSVGIVFPKSCTKEQRDQFETLILELIGLKKFPPQPPDSFGKSTDYIMNARASVNIIRTGSGIYSERVGGPAGYSNGIEGQGLGKTIASGFKAGGQLLSRGFEMGAIQTARAISYGAEHLKSNLPRDETERQIPTIIEDGTAMAKNLTGNVLSISSSILSTLTKMTANLGYLTTCYVKCSTAPLIDQAIERSGISRRTIDSITAEVTDVGDGIVKAGTEIYAGMDRAANILASALRDNTVEIVTHCYGSTAGGLLNQAGEVVGNVALTGLNAGQVVKPKNILLKSTKDAGLALAFEECSGDNHPYQE